MTLADDADDRRLRGHVHPDGWRQPAGDGLHDLVVVGGGTAGLVSAFIARALGARVALVERSLLGGDCLVTGCVPSKVLLRSARAASDIRRAADLGVIAAAPAPSLVPALARMRRLRADIAEHDAAARLTAAGIELHYGRARFVSGDAVEVEGRKLRFRRCILATGARAAMPSIPGLEGASTFTNETIFDLSEAPGRMLVLGGGPIGCELGQAFARLGTRVTIVQRGDRLLPRDDEDAAALLARVLEGEGVDVRLGSRLLRMHLGSAILRCGRGEETAVPVDAILVATGRRANVQDLELEKAGVALDANGFIATDDRLRTSNRRVFAAGDVAGRQQFTHAADAMARIAVQNALLPVRRRASALLIPWCTYTQPEIAHVGVSAAEARERGLVTVTAPLSDLDRAILDGEAEGFARLHVRGRSGRIEGATVVGPHAAELIAEAAIAIRAGVSAGTLEDTVHCYPSHAEALRRAAAAWRRTRLKPWMPAILRRWYRLLR